VDQLVERAQNDGSRPPRALERLGVDEVAFKTMLGDMCAGGPRLAG
jgi:hypothetical protein